MFAKRFFHHYWRYLLICGCAVIFTAPSCPKSKSNGDSSMLLTSSISTSGISQTGATINWNTNRPADSRVEYGLTTSYGNMVSDATLKVSHRLNLVGLTPNTLYHYKVTSKDAGGNQSASSDLTFTTGTSGSLPPPPPPFPVGSGEFVGPFASWKNVKTDYGAIGNGSADDTAKLQSGLDALSSGAIKTLYFPSGVYRITQTLRVHNTIYANVIGQDPEDTVLLWDGAAGGVMMHIDGVAHSRFNRLTWDGQNRAEVGVDQSKTSETSQHFDTGNEFSEDVFRFVGYGIRAGNHNIGAAETLVLRSRFIRNSKAGIITKTFNALDWWIWESYFEECAVGVTNFPGAGNFSVYNNVFKRSSEADIVIENTQFYSIRNNYSIGSKRFYYSRGTGQNGAMTAIQGNMILDTTEEDAMRIHDFGPVNIYDNFVRSKEGAVGPAIRITAADTLAFGNTFTVNNPISMTGSGRSRLDANTTVPRGNIVASEPVISKYVSKNRRVFPVPLGANTSTIQQAINSAAQFCGQRPIVHLPPGPDNYEGYQISSTLVVPANCDIQIVGDGGNSRLTWVGSGSGPVIRLSGPSKAILRDFRIHGASDRSGIAVSVENADQSGGRVYMQGVLANVSDQHSLLLDGVDHTRVHMRGFMHQEALGNGGSVKVVGGPSGVNGQGGVTLISGASSSNVLSYEVTQGGRLVVKDVWYETGGTRPGYIKLIGDGLVTFDQARVFTTPINSTAVDIQNYNGKATFIGLDIENEIEVTGTSNGSILALGLQGHLADYFFNSTAARTALVNSRWYDRTFGTRVVANKGSHANDLAFLRDMLTQTRGANLTDENLLIPDGITNVLMYRVVAESTRIGFHIKR